MAQPTLSAGANIVRFDFLAPLGANLEYNLFVDHGPVLPVLVSYERRVGAAWSLNAEGLANGGDPADRRTGAALAMRRYLRATGALAGPYAAPLVSYRSLKTTDGYFGSSPVITRSQRLGTGILLGWQLPLRRAQARRWTVDLAAGAIYWGRMGTDRVEDVNHFYATPTAWSSRDGWWADLRGGLGYQF